MDVVVIVVGRPSVPVVTIVKVEGQPTQGVGTVEVRVVGRPFESVVVMVVKDGGPVGPVTVEVMMVLEPAELVVV